MTPLEKDIERHLVRVIGRAGGMCLKWVCPGWSGVPDRLVLLPGGRLLFVELKRPAGGKIGSLQIWWAQKLRSLGFDYRLIKNHEDIKALEAELGGIDGPKTI